MTGPEGAKRGGTARRWVWRGGIAAGIVLAVSGLAVETAAPTP